MSGGLGFVPFEAIEHTADLAYVARGRTLPELFEHAALGMLQFLYDVRTIRQAEVAHLEVEGYDLEELLVTWLQELLYRHEIGRRLVGAVRVETLEPPTETGPARLCATVAGEEWDPSRHCVVADIKAATYHGIEISQEREPGGPEVHRVRIVLDI